MSNTVFPEYMIRPWVPMSNPVDQKHIGKLAEESSELTTAASRCSIQGIGESEPVTGKPNKEWLEDEIADVLANIDLCSDRFNLDLDRIAERARFKKEKLRQWFFMDSEESEESEEPLSSSTPRPAWIRMLTDDIFERIGNGDLPGVISELVEKRVAENAPLLPEVPWKVIAQFDHPGEDENERLIGFRCQMPENAPFMTYEKMEWLRAMLHGRDTVRN